MKKAAHWSVVLMTKGQARADGILHQLQAEGFMAKVKPLSAAMSGGENEFEILCLASEAQEAHQYLIEHGIFM